MPQWHHTSIPSRATAERSKPLCMGTAHDSMFVAGQSSPGARPTLDTAGHGACHSASLSSGWEAEDKNFCCVMCKLHVRHKRLTAALMAGSCAVPSPGLGTCAVPLWRYDSSDAQVELGGHGKDQGRKGGAGTWPLARWSGPGAGVSCSHAGGGGGGGGNTVSQSELLRTQVE